ncbi:vesicle-mediated transport protein Vid24 [Talaromyces islandicus]|uniref:Vesicle-mediated transport protein Vid24 n=1 Tax=Talaromyces islandicus TaxID=28573 RepID=A0A0U1LP67_TALIS|nr:vesicle-mediated transport protein Vid24 [Talaromyces islandicus]
MPTPSDNASDLIAASALAEEEPIAHATCPPEVIRQTQATYSVASEERPVDGQQHAVAEEIAATGGTTTEEDTQGSGNAEPIVIEPVDELSPKSLAHEEDAFMTTTLSAESAHLETKEDQSSSPTGSATSSVVSSSSSSSSFNYDFSNVRLLPNYTSSFLRSGSRFEGTQQSDSQVYHVDVEIKHVDMAESYLCGYLRIQGKFFCDQNPMLMN